VLDLLLAQHDLYAAGVDAPDFRDRLLELRSQVLRHAKREERYEFTYLRAAMDPETSQRLARAVRAAEALAPTRPHPSRWPEVLSVTLG
jgi:hypothetical protein